MAASLRIDTLKFAKRLTEAGLSREAAEAIVEGLGEADTSDLSTRSDLSALRGDMSKQFGEVRTETATLRTDMAREFGEVRTEMADIRTDIASLKADFYGRLWVMGAGIVGLTVALLKVLPG